MNVYSTNLANMKSMRREIVRLNGILGTRCMEDVKTTSGKEDQPKRPLYKGGRHPHIKDGLGHTKRGKTNGRKVINGYKCVQFMSNGRVGTDRPAQMVTHKQPRAAQPAQGGSAAPHRKGKVTSTATAHDKPMKKVYQQKVEPQKPKKCIWSNPNKYSYQPKSHAPRQSLTSCFVLKNNSKGDVFAKYLS
jgi:hypothetical protein